MTHALVPAGAANRPALLRWSQSPLRAAIRLYGRPAVEYVLEALLAAKEVAKVTVTGAPGLVSVAGEIRRKVRWSRGDGPVCGLEALPWDTIAALNAPELSVSLEGSFLVVACDLPLLTPQAVDDFVRSAKASGGDVVYPLIPQRAVAALAPGAGKPALRTREGAFVGGNVAWLARPLPGPSFSLLKDVHRRRKRPNGIGRLLGWSAALRLATGRMSLSELEERMRRLAGVDLRLVPVEHGCLGLDLDCPRDHLAALRCLAQRRGSKGVVQA